MKEVKNPRKPLIYYYVIVLLIMLVFDLIISPLISDSATTVTEVDYGTFMSMIEEQDIGEVEI
ncbi:MAG: cell division protein FtsH, partial [Lachnospiraceae bacterium]|nr:cell division protein FtsH [Lachnospiraceae bacterium]